MNVLAFWIAMGVLSISLVLVALISGFRKKWYRVYMANPETNEEHVCRSGWDTFWRSDEAGMMVFHRDDGKTVRIGKSWIQKIEEI